MLYTRKGDKGTTKLFGCDGRIAKTETEIEALGSVDELNTLLGVCRSRAFGAQVSFNGESLANYILAIQEDLFIVQAHIARAPKELRLERLDAVEVLIDAIEEHIPPPGGFLVPGEDELEALLDYARAVSRRVERRLIAARESRELSGVVYQYVNRLSSLLYALARLVAHERGVKEQHPSY